MVAVLSAYGIVQGTTLYAFIIPIIVLGVPIVDTCYAIVRRFYEKQPIFQPDKKHIHHRLLKRGSSDTGCAAHICHLCLFKYQCFTDHAWCQQFLNGTSGQYA